MTLDLSNTGYLDEVAPDTVTITEFFVPYSPTAKGFRTLRGLNDLFDAVAYFLSELAFVAPNPHIMHHARVGFRFSGVDLPDFEYLIRDELLDVMIPYLDVLRCFGCRYVLGLSRGECRAILKFGSPRYRSPCVHEHVARRGLTIIWIPGIIGVRVSFRNSGFPNFSGP